MKGLKITLAAAASALLLAAPAMAFHDGGVAKCEGCHTMHNSLDGATMPTTAAYGGSQFAVAGYLLQGNGSTSDACLVCHQGDSDTAPSSYHVSTINTALQAPSAAANSYPLQRGPGGDFGWINLNTGSNYKRGHNIIASTHNYGVEPRFGATSPGGTYPKGLFNCASCHDPHGKFRNVKTGGVLGGEVTTGAPIVESGSYNSDADIADGEALGVFRFLAGNGYSPKSIAGAHTFNAQAPIALVNSSYNRGEATADTHVAYGSGMSEWCANCHGDLLENAYVSGEAGHTHPAGNSAVLGATIASNYNAYVSSGITGAANYTSLVPFEEGVAVTRSALKTKAVNGIAAGGAQASSNVSCLSCHRANASGFNSMLRFDPATFMTVADTTGAVVYSTAADASAMLTAAYYDRPATNFGAYQRALCNKCHNKD